LSLGGLHSHRGNLHFLKKETKKTNTEIHGLIEETYGFDRTPTIHYSKWESGLMLSGWTCSCGNERRFLTSAEMQSRHTALWMEVQSRIIIQNTTRLFNIPGIHLPQLSSLRNRQQEGRGTNPRGMWREQEGECSGESQVGDHAQGVWGDGTCIMQQWV